MNVGLADLKGLGDQIAAAWRAEDFAEERLANLARTTLLEARLHQRLDTPALLAELVSSGELPLQWNDLALFSEPLITVYANGYLAVDLCLTGNDGTIRGHAHPGVFQVLDGSALHATYDFEVVQQVHACLVLGRLSRPTVRILRSGDVGEVPLAPISAHRSLRLAGLGLLLVVRSEMDVAPPHRYLSSGVAVSSMGGSTGRQLSFSLAALPRLAENRARLLADADFGMLLALVDAGAAKVWNDRVAIQGLLEIGQWVGSPERARLVATVIHESRLRATAAKLLEETEDEVERLVTASMLATHDRTSVSNLLTRERVSTPAEQIIRELLTRDLVESTLHARRLLFDGAD